MNIYMKSIELQGYDIKMNKWMISMNNSILAYAPVPHPVLPPHLVSNWKKFDVDKKTWVSSALFHLEQLEEKEYLEIFPESNQPTHKGMYQQQCNTIVNIDNLSFIFSHYLPS